MPANDLRFILQAKQSFDKPVITTPRLPEVVGQRRR